MDNLLPGKIARLFKPLVEDLELLSDTLTDREFMIELTEQVERMRDILLDFIQIKDL
jgi:hypothetical protein